ncbi:uncharacterized protein LOC118190924 [Stegodyphus dumicola]|uniref:uncharacterized protein LOC118190924 n=1 Tax=Stegodyphus dumicola TaxID=202533 RepID=UPI0015B2255C|nr:uncharacterized protein LOC118190924 [Stegodyphus dumicola]
MTTALPSNATKEDALRGSCAGPVLWNLTFNACSGVRLATQHTSVVAYADDAALLVKGRTRKELESNSTTTCSIFDNACSALKLKISTEKTTALFIPKAGTNPSRRPCTKLQGKNIKFVKTLKYLGLTWDSGLTWLSHVQELRNKTSIIARKARTFQRKNWGQSHHIQKLLYHTVAENIATYASATWVQPMSVRKIKLLTSLQRPFALNLTRAYRTTATSSATVLAGLIPLHIIVEMEAVTTKVVHLRKDASLSNTTYCPIQYETLGHPLHTHPAVKGKGVNIDLSRHSNANETQVPTQGSHFYSDGSKREDGVGCAYVYYQDGQCRQEWKGRLQLQNSVSQAEVLAITAATQHIIHQDITHATLHTNSFSTLQALQNHQHTSLLIISLHHFLQRHAHINLLLKWINTHADNEGNENADRLAKQAVGHRLRRPIQTAFQHHPHI